MKLLFRDLCRVFVTLAALSSQVAAAPAAILSVGAGKTYTAPSQAAAAAKDGDTIEIDPGTYAEDCAVFKADSLTIRGSGQRPVIDSHGQAAEEKAIWVIKGDNTTIENVELTGCAVKDRNGAGVKLEGRGLTLRKCFIHDNENGIFTNDNPKSDITIEFCEFTHNGHGNGQSHNIYVNYMRELKIRGCYIHNANAGDDVKSRAQNNFVLYNQIVDDDTANTAASLNFPNGGACYVVGNIIRKGHKSGNAAFVSIGSEGPTNSKQSLCMINNTFVSARRASSLFRAQGGTSLRIMDNILANVATEFEASGALEMMQINHNLAVNSKDFGRNFVDPKSLDFHLTANSDARKIGIAAGFADGIDLTPRFEYVHPCSVKGRDAGSHDLGAFSANKP